MSANGFVTTTADEQYARGVAAGKAERARGLNDDALARRVEFDDRAAATCSPTFAAFHRGRIEGLLSEPSQ